MSVVTFVRTGWELGVATDTTKYPTMYKTAPQTKNYPAKMSIVLRMRNSALKCILLLSIANDISSWHTYAIWLQRTPTKTVHGPRVSGA